MSEKAATVFALIFAFSVILGLTAPYWGPYVDEIRVEKCK